MLLSWGTVPLDFLNSEINVLSACKRKRLNLREYPPKYCKCYRNGYVCVFVCHGISHFDSDVAYVLVSYLRRLFSCSGGIRATEERSVWLHVCTIVPMLGMLSVNSSFYFYLRDMNAFSTPNETNQLSYLESRDFHGCSVRKKN